MVVYATRVWRYFVDERKIDDGEVSDAGLPVHIVVLDVLASADTGLHVMFPAARAPTTRILASAESMAETAPLPPIPSPKPSSRANRAEPPSRHSRETRSPSQTNRWMR